ncbi:MAG TPA: glycosyltransferase [Vicinamibacterales bacterium]|nr:glycosyltransferase [Vicinamibacterales bacterium]
MNDIVTPTMLVPPLPGPAAVDATVLICSYNRADDLRETLDSLAQTRTDGAFTWELLVVDNNSIDDTREAVLAKIDGYPVPLRYLFEPAQGKSNALNTGLRASRGRIIAFTDDDVRVPAAWLGEAIGPLLQRPDIEYTGGPVRPIWQSPKPRWLDERGNLGGTIAVKDHGGDAFVFEDERKTPLGVNMAVRRSLIERIGGFNPALGRKGASLLGQEQADFFYRSRRAGARGLYVPSMVLEHIVPAGRLTKRYFYRWWYWKGISHARLHALHGRTELDLDLRTVRRIGGVPAYLVRSAGHHAASWLIACATGAAQRRTEHAANLAYIAGYSRDAALAHRRPARESSAASRTRATVE